MGVCIRVPATTANLGPGFDTFGMALSLYNTLEVDWSSGNLQIDVTGDGADLVPVNKTNAVYRAMQIVFERADQTALLEKRGLYIRIHNAVPVTRGMGSSATAIVGGLWAANELLGHPLSVDELLNLAVQLEGHPDNVAPAILGGIVVSGIVKEKAYAKRFSPPPGMKCVVAVPDFQLATKTSRKALPPAVPHGDAVSNVNRVGLMVAALMDGNLEMFCDLMEDRLHEPYRTPLVPGMKEAIAAAREAGAMGAVLSGSGPALIAFCRDGAAAIGNALQSGFATEGIESTILHLQPAEEGVAVLASIS
ncbi:homoserine kinase [Effusibacillus lacus]|uniref:Homoserine kinase n=1 Tax=Effusibacillus lacus TaxID=1348429 RepID=A0A292YNW9_9BACL|nr:homoserine kinase [Effusibacillus lacus]TCS72554.1 homoserine kinase [Effusibacillus lacus]GAX90886.1 homoserine kinase [Effusibacillus lacus]